MTTIKLPAELENLNTLLDFIQGAAAGLGLKESSCYEIRLACEETLTNIINYAYSKSTGDIEIQYTASENPKGIEINITDSGKPFNPLEEPKPDVTAPVEHRKIGGLGIFLVKQVMDKVSYQRTSDKNILTLVKQ